MVFPVVGGTQSTGYDISNSMMTDADSSTFLSKTLSSPNTDKFTVSYWWKGCFTGRNNQGFALGKTLTGETGDYTQFTFRNGSNGRLAVNAYDGVADNNVFNSNTPAEGPILRDSTAWVHVVIAVDTGQGTAANRVRVYFNNQEVTLTITSAVSQNADLFNASGSSFYIARSFDDTYGDGYLADFYYSDGYQYTPSDFGETNDHGIWVPKKAAISYGTNGFKLEFQQTGTSQNSSGMGADTSGNDNHLAVSGAGTDHITVDTPNNSFATLNPHEYQAKKLDGGGFQDGFLNIATPNNNHSFYPTWFGVTKGKWYAEVKIIDEAATGGSNYAHFGVISEQGNDFDSTANSNSNGNEKLTAKQYNYGIAADNGKFTSNNASGSTYGAVWGSDNDIMSIALDLDNNRVYFAKNGQWADGSGNFDESSPTGYGTIVDPTNTVMGAYFIAIGDNVSNGNAESVLDATMNFGVPTGGFTISSGNADANGYGNFEYAPPSGYYACCTKNLAEYG